MLSISYIKRELQDIMDEIHFTPLQKRIIQYRLDNESRIKMADLENVSVSTIDREIKKIYNKMYIAYELFSDELRY